jgi:hypothetical protein
MNNFKFKRSFRGDRVEGDAEERHISEKDGRIYLRVSVKGIGEILDQELSEGTEQDIRNLKRKEPLKESKESRPIGHGSNNKRTRNFENVHDAPENLSELERESGNEKDQLEVPRTKTSRLVEPESDGTGKEELHLPVGEDVIPSGRGNGIQTDRDCKVQRTGQARGLLERTRQGDEMANHPTASEFPDCLCRMDGRAREDNRPGEIPQSESSNPPGTFDLESRRGTIELSWCKLLRQCDATNLGAVRDQTDTPHASKVIRSEYVGVGRRQGTGSLESDTRPPGRKDDNGIHTSDRNAHERSDGRVLSKSKSSDTDKKVEIFIFPLRKTGIESKVHFERSYELGLLEYNLKLEILSFNKEVVTR